MNTLASTHSQAQSRKSKHLASAQSLQPLVAGVFAQPAGLAQTGDSQFGRQHRRAADVAGRLWLRHGRV